VVILFEVITLVSDEVTWRPKLLPLPFVRIVFSEIIFLLELERVIPVLLLDEPLVVMVLFWKVLLFELVTRNIPVLLPPVPLVAMVLSWAMLLFALSRRIPWLLVRPAVLMRFPMMVLWVVVVTSWMPKLVSVDPLALTILYWMVLLCTLSDRRIPLLFAVPLVTTVL